MKIRNVLVMVCPMSAERVSGIARYASEHSWNLLIQDRLGHRPLAWSGDGVIVTLRDDLASFRNVSALIQRGIPVVDLTVNRPDISLPRVTSDHRAIGRLAAQHFAEREFRNVVWFSTAWGNVHRLRYAGLMEALPQKPLRWVLSEEVAAARQSDWTAFLAWIRERLSSAPAPLAVLCYDETDAARLLYAARELGTNVPEELAILSIGNNPLVCENQFVPLSSVDQNLERGGYEAAALLDKLMSSSATRSKHKTPSTILIPPAGIVTRRSTDVIAVANPDVRRALEYITTHLGKPIGSPQIADALNLKRSGLDILFRSHLRRSVGEEIRRQRLARVKLLLKTTDMTISSIAAVTGYCTPAHLSNAFRDTFRLTPKEWRRLSDVTLLETHTGYGSPLASGINVIPVQSR